VRKDLGIDTLPEASLESCLRFTSADLISIGSKPNTADQQWTAI
jgi:hypothetical protein